MCFGFLVDCVCLLFVFVCWFICFILLLSLLVMFLVLFWARPIGQARFRCFVWVICFFFCFFGFFLILFMVFWEIPVKGWLGVVDF